jgi:hypothetical protein
MKFTPVLTFFILSNFAIGINSFHKAAAQLSQTPQSSPSPSVETTQQEKIAFRRKTLHTMNDELEQVAEFVKSRRFQSAKTTFNKALKKWYIFGGTIKRIAPEGYEKISPDFDVVKNRLNQPNPSISRLGADLATLIKDVNVALPISDAKE